MRRSLCGAAGLMAVGLLAIVPAFSNAQTEQHEKELLKVRMWNRWSDVMKLYGQPTRIEIGAVTSPSGGGSAAAGGSAMGGGMGAPSSMGTSSMGGGMSMGKMGGKSALPGMSGMMGSGGMSQGMGGGAMTGMDKGGGGSPFAGGMGSGGMSQGMMGGSGGGAGFGGGASSEGDGNDGEVTWVYEKGPVTDYFLFNKDGRVIQVQSFGRRGPATTAQKVTLGDSLGKIFDKYGWTANVQKDLTNGTMTLDYSKDRNVLFQFEGKGDKNYKVVGITVGITDRAQIRDFGGPALKSGTAGAGMGMGGPMGGKMGGMGMSGGPMGGKRRGGGGGGAAMSADN